MKTFFIILSLIGVLTSSLTLLHGWYLQRQEAEETVQSVKDLAHKGASHAQLRLATMFRLGNGVEQSHSKAADWYRKAANQGQADAQFLLGLLLRTGEGVSQDLELAAEWFNKAANQGIAAAQYNLGWMYQTGQGTPLDPAASAKWYRDAADQGLAAAQFKLATMYDQGYGVHRDHFLATDWYYKGILHKGGSPKRWNEAAARKVLLGFKYHLGRTYEAGHGTKQDLKQSALWFRSALDQTLPEHSIPHPIANVYRTADPPKPEIQFEFGTSTGSSDEFGLTKPAPTDSAHVDLLNTKPAPTDSAHVDLLNTKKTWPQSLHYLLQSGTLPERIGEQFELANSYRDGTGVAKDLEKAEEWYRKLAVRDFSPAQTELGRLYEQGHGVPQNYKLAASWFQKAANQGATTAQSRLGLLYQTGRGVQQDYTKAARWYWEASTWSYGETEQALALMYEGEGTLVYGERAGPATLALKQRSLDHKVLSLLSLMLSEASRQPTMASKMLGNKQLLGRTLYHLGQAYELGHARGLGGILSPNHSLAVHHYNLAAQAGFLPSNTRLAELYERGLGVPQSFKKAFDYYQLGAQLGDPFAEYKLGMMYATGRGTSEDMPAAIAWLEKSATVNFGHALVALGEFYENGRFVAKDLAKAVDFYWRGALLHDPMALLNLYRLYAAGLVHSERDKQIFQLSRQAAKDGDRYAALLLGVMFATGQGVKADPEQAALWYRMATKKGLAQAMYHLGRLHEKGDVVPLDMKKAVGLYRQALHLVFSRILMEKGMARNPIEAQGFDHVSASRNGPPATVQVGEHQPKGKEHFTRGQMHAAGKAVAQDWREAAVWYEKAAALGNLPAQHNLAVMHYRGQGVPADITGALRWFKRAARNGYMPAQFALAELYRRDRSIQNPVLAHKWYNVWASKLEGEEANWGGKIREYVAEELTTEELERAQRMASEWNVK